MQRLCREDGLLLLDLLKNSYIRLELIVTFLAVLELIKLKIIRLSHSTIPSDIRLYLTS